MTLTKEKNGMEKSCCFCRWAELLYKIERKEIDEKKLEGENKKWYQYQYLGRSKNFFAVLDRHPRLTGDTMIISREFNPIHYTDIADPHLIKLRPTEDDFNFIRRIIEKLKTLTEDREHGKVYMMSMCEYWEPKDINPNWKEGEEEPNTTEHLHFHLLPRHEKMRTKEVAQEHMFTRPQDYGCTLEMLEKVNEKIRS